MSNLLPLLADQARAFVATRPFGMGMDDQVNDLYWRLHGRWIAYGGLEHEANPHPWRKAGA